MIVRPIKEGYYEIISGHRRKYAAERLGYKKIPVIIRMMQDDEAVVTMVDSNLQREQIIRERFMQSSPMLGTGNMKSRWVIR